MIEGLWTIEFTSSANLFGSGVVVLTGKRFLGGDAGYYYTGEYTVEDHHIRGKADVIRFDKNSLSVFGDMDSLTIDFDGEVSEGAIEGTGHLTGHPDMQVAIRCSKKTDL